MGHSVKGFKAALTSLFLLCLALLGLYSEAGAVGTKRSHVRTRVIAPADQLIWPKNMLVIVGPHTQWVYGGTSPRNGQSIGRAVDFADSLGCVAGLWICDWAEDTFTLNTNANLDSFLAIRARAQFPWYDVLGNHEATDTSDVNSPDPNPYAAAIARNPDLFQGRNFYSTDIPGVNVTLFATQNHANVPDTTSDGLRDYGLNNPSYGYTPEDYDGVNVSTSPQGRLLSQWYGNIGTKWAILAGGRNVWGTNTQDSRLNMTAAKDLSTGFYKRFENGIPTGTSAFYISEDQHASVWFTKRLFNGSVATGTQKGVWNLMSSFAGCRPADTTSAGVSGHWMEAVLSRTIGNDTQMFGHTSGGWAELAYSTGGDVSGRDAGCIYNHTFIILRVYGDMILVQFYRVFTSQTAGAYTVAGHTFSDRDVYLVHQSEVHRRPKS